MSDFASTGDVMVLGRRTVDALERIAAALDRSAPAPTELRFAMTKMMQTLATDRAVALAVKEHAGPMTEEEGAAFDGDYPTPEDIHTLLAGLRAGIIDLGAVRVELATRTGPRFDVATFVDPNRIGR